MISCICGTNNKQTQKEKYVTAKFIAKEIRFWLPEFGVGRDIMAISNSNV